MFQRSICLSVSAALLSGCSTMVVYRPNPGETQTLKYVQGVGTMTAVAPDHELFMYATYKMQAPTQPTFTIGYANNTAGAVDFSTDNVKAFFRGVPVPIYTYTERVDDIAKEKRGKQIALAILGGLAAGAAAYGASHQTYRSNYSGSVWNGRGTTNFSGSSMLRVYDPMSGIIAGAAVGGVTAVGIQQMEFNAQNQELAANSILQANTVNPQTLVTGDLILRGCCDQYPGANDMIRFEVSVNSRVHLFEFARVAPNAPPAPSKDASILATAAPRPVSAAPATPAVPATVVVPASSVVAVSSSTENLGRPVPLLDAPVKVQTVSAPTPVAPPAGKPLPSVGEDSYNAEQLARSRTCSAQPVAKLLAKGPGFESYSVACASGDILAIRCEMGQCRILQ